MSGSLIAVIAIAVLAGVAYLIGHTHGKSATPPVVVVGGNPGTGSTAPAGGTQPGDAPQIKAEG